MSDVVLLTYYCALILVASMIGGMIPVWFQLTHRRMQFAVSFVAGVMLGVGVLHMIPHAVVEFAASTALSGANGSSSPAVLSIESVARPMTALLLGMLVMFFIERFFCFHHHDVPQQGEHAHNHEGDCHDHDAGGKHDLSWSGAALGLALHSVLNGVALAAAVEHGANGTLLAGFGTFLVIFLHKPFDAMTIGMLMARGRSSLARRHAVNALFSLAIPLGAVVFYFGLMTSDGGSTIVAYALAFSAGTFLCISLSDLLPELQFHQHDRVKLSLALLAGLGVAYVAGRFETAAHGPHSHPANAARDTAGESASWPALGTTGTSVTFYRPTLTLASVVSVEFMPWDARCYLLDVRFGDPDRKPRIKHLRDFGMSTQHLRPWQKHRVGQVLFTVELDSAGEQYGIERHRRLGELSRRLVELFTAYRLPATWAAGNPAQSAATAAVIRSGVDHQLAILGNAGWIGPTVGRTRFAQELARRIGQAGSAGINITSLVPRVASIQEHVDLLLKQGISAVAGLGESGRPRTQQTVPRALHYGLWELPVTQRLPLPPSWLPVGGRSQMRKIRSAARETATYHLVIDAVAIEQEAARGEAIIARIVRGVAELRDRGLVRVETLTTAAARLANVPAVSPQRSILRQAA